MSNICAVMLLAHFLGNFYLQSNKGIESKNKNYLIVLLYCLIYSASAALLLWPYYTRTIADCFFALIISHLVIESIRFVVMQKAAKRRLETSKVILRVDWLYLTDQIAHVVIIFLISFIYRNTYCDVAVSNAVIHFLQVDMLTFDKIVRVLLLFVIVLRPVSLTFYKLVNIELLSAKKEGDDSDRDSVKGAGALIGYLERIVILLLLFLGEYAAIGLVIAAKSIARFNSKIKTEFYIIGTFYGVVSTIIPYILVWKL